MTTSPAFTRIERAEVGFCTEQPNPPFSVVRLATFYACQCPADWLEGRNALDMMLRVKGEAAWAVLYGDRRTS